MLHVTLSSKYVQEMRNTVKVSLMYVIIFCQLCTQEILLFMPIMATGEQCCVF